VIIVEEFSAISLRSAEDRKNHNDLHNNPVRELLPLASEAILSSYP
jgi:hypothetical protein